MLGLIDSAPSHRSRSQAQRHRMRESASRAGLALVAGAGVAAAALISLCPGWPGAGVLCASGSGVG
jgi:hypothetical protein